MAKPKRPQAKRGDDEGKLDPVEATTPAADSTDGGRNEVYPFPPRDDPSDLLSETMEIMDGMNSQWAAQRYYIAQLIGSEDPDLLMGFFVAEFGISLRQARELGSGDITFLLAALYQWKNEPPESRPGILAEVRKRRDAFTKTLRTAELTDEMRRMCKAFVAAASKGGDWNLDGTEGERSAAICLPDLVTLLQMAAMVHKSKSTFDRLKKRGLPDPVVEGGGGKTALYDWKIVRPWLTAKFGVPLPEKFPRL